MLDVQEVDRTLGRLAHRRRTLPEHAELAALQARLTELRGRRVELETRASDLARDQRKADADVEQVKTRRARDQQRLDTGRVSSPRELEQLQHEIVALDRRIATLEDAELEVMEELEQVQSELATVQADLADLEVQEAAVRARRDEAVAALDAEAGDAGQERARLVADLPEALLALYDKVRAQQGGVGAAALERRQCQGCRLDIPQGDLDELTRAPADEVLRCPECNRILVRARGTAA